MERENQQTGNDLLPRVTDDLPGIGGTVKMVPEDFYVEEIPLYELSGEGEHIYLKLERSGLNTRDLVRRLAKAFDLKEAAVGTAGQKDRNARTVQFFSLYAPRLSLEEVRETAGSWEDVVVQEITRHGNKLRTGHLRGNLFRILIRDCRPGFENLLPSLAEKLIKGGFPNYYGEQRFGKEGDNALRGREILTGKRSERGWLRTFLLSAYQSELFNRWLRLRIQRGLFETILEGDLARKTETGGLFLVEDIHREEEAFRNGSISYTGPMFGGRMRQPLCPEALTLETRVLEEEGVDGSLFERGNLEGSRRSGRVVPGDLTYRVEDENVCLLSFSLPAGSYATALIRELTKNDEETR